MKSEPQIASSGIHQRKLQYGLWVHLFDFSREEVAAFSEFAWHWKSWQANGYPWRLQQQNAQRLRNFSKRLCSSLELGVRIYRMLGNCLMEVGVHMGDCSEKLARLAWWWRRWATWLLEGCGLDINTHIRINLALK